VRAYLTYVRPLLEYNSIIWSPHSKGDVDAIEKVQRRFTKRIPGFKNYSYVERLHLLHMPRLEMRRIAYRMTSFGVIKYFLVMLKYARQTFSNSD